MATIGNTFPTLLDVSKQFTADGTALPIAELLHKTNPAFDDIPFEEANGGSYHKISARSGLPAVAWRKLNGGVAATKSDFADVTESMGMLSALGKVDKTLVDMSGNPAAFRLNQNKGHIESMGQTFASTLFYGDSTTTPESFLGLAPRFSSLAATNGSQILDAAGAANRASIWLVGWGEGSVTGIYPKGSQAGIQHKDYGEELVSDGNGGEFPAYRDWFQLDSGIAVYDWRNVVRIANVDTSTLTKNASAGADLIDLMVQAIEQINNVDGLRPVFYMPRAIRSFLRRQIANKSNVWLSMGEVAGQKVVEFDGIPCRRVDALTSSETAVA